MTGKTKKLTAAQLKFKNDTERTLRAEETATKISKFLSNAFTLFILLTLFGAMVKLMIISWQWIIG